MKIRLRNFHFLIALSATRWELSRHDSSRSPAHAGLGIFESPAAALACAIGHDAAPRGAADLPLFEAAAEAIDRQMPQSAGRLLIDRSYVIRRDGAAAGGAAGGGAGSFALTRECESSFRRIGDFATRRWALRAIAFDCAAIRRDEVDLADADATLARIADGAFRHFEQVADKPAPAVGTPAPAVGTSLSQGGRP